jgi:HAD superfamily hydrolase (TIGR01484 family)
MSDSRYLVCTDLDRTLIPNGPADESPTAAALFARLVGRAEITLAYVSGRHRTLVDDAIRAYELPLPDYVIGDVGTTLYRVGPQRLWELEHAWEDRIARDWSGHIAADLLPMLAGVDGLRAQEPEKQNRFKLSFYLDPARWNEALDASIRRRLAAADIDARLIWSIDDLTGEGLLDILPRSASKRHAIEALMEVAGFALGDTVFCGDSGNDLEVLASRIPAVLVANARPDVRREAAAMAAAAGHPDALYIARGGYRGMNGNYRGGMLEGIVHYHPELDEWLETDAAKGGAA